MHVYVFVCKLYFCRSTAQIHRAFLVDAHLTVLLVIILPTANITDPGLKYQDEGKNKNFMKFVFNPSKTSWLREFPVIALLCKFDL